MWMAVLVSTEFGCLEDEIHVELQGEVRALNNTRTYFKIRTDRSWRKLTYFGFCQLHLSEETNSTQNILEERVY